MAPSTSDIMTKKLNGEFSLNLRNPQGPERKDENINFEINQGHIKLVQENSFSGGENEEVVSYRWKFLQSCSTIKIKGVSQMSFALDCFRILFERRHWIGISSASLNSTSGTSASQHSINYLSRSEATALCEEIICFQQEAKETAAEAWKRYYEIIQFSLLM